MRSAQFPRSPSTPFAYRRGRAFAGSARPKNRTGATAHPKTRVGGPQISGRARRRRRNARRRRRSAPTQSASREMRARHAAEARLAESAEALTGGAETRRRQAAGGSDSSASPFRAKTAGARESAREAAVFEAAVSMPESVAIRVRGSVPNPDAERRPAVVISRSSLGSPSHRRSRNPDTRSRSPGRRCRLGRRCSPRRNSRRADNTLPNKRRSDSRRRNYRCTGGGAPSQCPPLLQLGLRRCPSRLRLELRRCPSPRPRGSRPPELTAYPG